MECGKLYKWKSVKAREIPLPQIAHEILECGSDKIFRYYPNGIDHSKEFKKDSADFDVIIGSKNKKSTAQSVLKHLNLDNQKIDLETVIDKIELRKPSDWFIEEGILPRKWSWTSQDNWTESLNIAEIANTIIKYKTDKVYRLRDYHNIEEFEVIVGVDSLDDAVELAVGFDVCEMEESFRSGESDYHHGYTIDEIIEDELDRLYIENEQLISLWE